MRNIIIIFLIIISYSNTWTQNTDIKMEELGFKKIEIRELSDNIVKLFADDWGLVTAGNKEKFNTMTISWGGIINLWNKESSVIFIKPERFTYEFIEKHQAYTISFFDHDEYKNDLLVCGTKSGRDGDKLKETKLNSISLPSGEVAFKEARVIMECKIIYQNQLDPKFTPEEEKEKYYKTEQHHKMYVGEILALWIKE